MKGFGKENKFNQKDHKFAKSIKPVPSEKYEKLKMLSRGELIAQGCKLHLQGDILSAEKYYQYFLDKGFIDPIVLSNYGVIYKQKGDISNAIDLYERSINIYPNNPEAYSNLGSLFKDIGYLEKAEHFTRKAIEVNQNYVEAYSSLGSILKDRGKLKEAESIVRKAIEIKPDFADAYLNLGSILIDLNELKEAAYFTTKAINIKPDYSIAYNNLGSIMKDLGQLENAKRYMIKAIKLNPNLVIAHYNLGEILTELGDLPDAISSYEKTLGLNKKYSLAKAGLIKASALICDWTDIDKYYHWLHKLGIEDETIEPLSFMAYEDNPQKHLARAEKYYKNRIFRNDKVISCSPKERIRVGYFSSDFYNHATMYLLVRIFELHDHTNFEIYAYDYGHNEKDSMTQRLIENVDIYQDISMLSEAESVELARNDKLDIAVDLKGITKNSRLFIFSNRVAPVQVAYLGYPGSTGIKTIDYIIADRIVIPENNKKFFSEKVIYMPDCYQCNDDRKEIFRDIVSRADCALPEKGFVFTCFNANYKIKPPEFDIWMRLLLNVEHSVLWLYKSNRWSEHNILKEANKRGVDSSRLIFAEKKSLSKHLSRHCCGDLALDTFNINGHTTTSDALWAGLPVLTKIGDSFASRVSASLLYSLGLDELVAFNKRQYEEIALELATDPKRISNLKYKLLKAKSNSSLFKSSLFTRNLENLFKEMISRQA